MTNLENAKQRLQAGELTCVLCKGGSVTASRLRGVRPLVGWYAGGCDFSGFSAADKVVGRATAFLYVLLGVKAVYAGIVSQAALAVLEANGIAAEYGLLVENIINRAGDGICPFEQAVLEIDAPEEAYRAIRQKLAQLNIPL